MKYGSTRWVWIVAAFLAIHCACTAPLGRRDGSPAAVPSAEDRRPPRLDHLTPRRDSMGGVPTHFAWTPVAGADRYAIGLWNEVDMLVWRQDNLREPSVTWPAELEIELGTYFWSVTALRDDRPVAESGRSAFVIVR